MNLYLNVESINEYKIFIHKRSRKKYEIEIDKLTHQLDIMPKGSYAVFDDDETVGDVVIVHNDDYKQNMDNDMQLYEKLFVPLAPDQIGIILL